MKKRKFKIKDVLSGIKDGIFPNISNSVDRDENNTTLNRTRSFFSVLSWIILVGFVTGYITWEQALEIFNFLSSNQ